MPFGAGGPVTDYKMDVGSGWASLLDQLDEELRAVSPGYQTVQVKEKFGRLRVYVEGNPVQADISGLGTVANVKIESTATSSNWRTVQDVLDKYELKSSQVCENCGQPGELDTSHFWIKTLCPACKARRDEERREAWGKRSRDE